MKILVAQTAFGDTECRNQRGQLDKSNVRGEESTTRQRKPYFIKLENKNIMLGDKQTLKKKGMAGREHASGHTEGDGWSGVFACA